MWIRIIKSGLDQSVERLFYKTPGRRFRPQWFFSAFFSFFFFSFIIVILNYCKVDYKVFIIRNNKLIYRSAQEKNSFFAFTPRTKILKRELSRRKLREISRKFAQTIFFSPRDFAQLLREFENSESFKKMLTV